MVRNLLQAIRPFNLFIVGLIQLLLYYNILIPSIVNPRLTALSLGGFVLSTLLLTAGGYLINDYYDYKGDKINKTDWHQLTQSQLLKSYIFVTLVGFISSIWVALSINHLHYTLLYLLGALLLFLYSLWGKRQALIGNVMVSAFCGLSIIILLLTEYPAIQNSLSSNSLFGHQTIRLISGLSVFAFLITLVREIVKDVEDLAGDQAQGYQTLPIKIGIPRTRMMIMWYLAITLILAVVWGYYHWEIHSLVANIYFIFCVIGSVIFLLYKASHLHENASYTELSKLLKSTMLIGIIYVILV